MKKSKRCAILVLTALMLLLLLLAGCGSEKSGNTISEPEITADYLDGEYADQLINDGAGTMLGTVSVEQSGDSYIAHVTEKEVVPSSDTDDGYYIADTNVSKDICPWPERKNDLYGQRRTEGCHLLMNSSNSRRKILTRSTLYT